MMKTAWRSRAFGLLVAAGAWAGCQGPSAGPASLGRAGLDDGPAACIPTQLDDEPDLGFADTNCDGIDGTKLNAVFVSPSGDDGNDGSMLHPKRTIFAAQATATAGAAPKDIYLDRGRYE